MSFWSVLGIARSGRPAPERTRSTYHAARTDPASRPAFPRGLPMPAPATNIASILGPDAAALLGYESKTVSKSKLHLPGPDFMDRVFSQTDRSPVVLRNFQTILNHGRLG